MNPKSLLALIYDQTIEDDHQRQLRQKLLSVPAVIVGLVAAVGGFLYGYDTGLINDILEMKYVKHNIPSGGHDFLTHERALLTAVLSLGTFFGALIAPLMLDSYGRKLSIMLSAGVIFNAGNILQVAATGVPLLCVGRGVSGLAVGFLSAIVPLYQAEASPKWVRGSIVFTYQWAITWGLLVASAVCQATRRMSSTALYRIPIGIQFLWLLALCVGMFFLPESPRYFVQKDNIQAAIRSLLKLRRLPQEDDDLVEELVEIKANYDYEISFGETTLIDCFRLGGGRHKQKLRILTGMGLHACQQCSGINFIFYYGVNFFATTNIGNYYLVSFFTYLVNVVFTIFGIIFVDTIGRRKLLLHGGISMSVCNFVIAIVGVAVAQQRTRAILLIVFSCCFIACFASLWGGAVWAVTADIYGISIRQKAIAVTVATNWLVNFVFAFITPYLIDTGSHTAALGNKIFFIWGGANAVGVVFVYFMVYETRGLKLEEIDFMYLECKNSRLSEKFVSRAIDYSRMPQPAGQSGKPSGVATPNSEKSHTSEPKNQLAQMLLPSFSNTLGESLDNSMMSSHGVSDYQLYLRSLQEQSTNTTARHPPSSQSSATTHRMMKPKNKPLQEHAHVLDHVDLPTKGNVVIATPFFTSPPSDSDSDEDDWPERPKDHRMD